MSLHGIHWNHFLVKGFDESFIEGDVKREGSANDDNSDLVLDNDSTSVDASGANI